MSNQTPTQENKGSKDHSNAKNVIMGIGMLTVIASIAYAASVIVLGTQGWTPRILIAPMVIFAAVVLIKQFTKQGEQ